MDSELRPRDEALEIEKYDPAVQEEKLGAETRDLLSFLIAQSERTEKPLSLHVYTDRTRLHEAIKSFMQPFVPPKFEKAADILYDRLTELAEPVFDSAHPSAPLRLVINIASNPVVDRLKPDAPAAYALLDIKHGTERSRAALAKDIHGIDPELHDVPPGLMQLVQPADLPPTDKQELVNKLGGNPFYFNRSELRDNAEWQAEHARGQMPYSGISPETSRSGGSIGALEEIAAGGLLAETFLERQNRENREFFKKREEDERIRHGREQETKTFEDKKRSDEEFFRKQEQQERRRQTQDYETGMRENIEADNAIAEAIAKLEATFGLIHEREGAISEYPHDASELAVLGGEVGALRRFLASGRGSSALRARASADVQKASALGAEFKRLRHDEGAAHAGAATHAGDVAAIETRAEQSREAAAITTVETALARARANEVGERLNPQESPEVAALRAAEAGLAGIPMAGLLGARAGEDFELGREELGEIMRLETATQATRARAGEAPATQTSLSAESFGAAAQITGGPAPARLAAVIDAGEAAELQEENRPAEIVAKPVATSSAISAEEVPQPSEQTGSSLMRDMAVEEAAGTVRDQVAQPVQKMELAPSSDEEAAAERPRVAAADLAHVVGADGGTSPSVVSDTAPSQPSERQGSHLMQDMAFEEAAGTVRDQAARPVPEMQVVPSDMKAERAPVADESAHHPEAEGEIIPATVSTDQPPQVQQGSRLVRDIAVEQMAGAVRDQVAQPVQKADQAGPQPALPEVPKTPGPSEVPQRPTTPEIPNQPEGPAQPVSPHVPEQSPPAQQPEMPPPTTPQPETGHQPSENEKSHLARDVIEGRIVETAVKRVAQPVEAQQTQNRAPSKPERELQDMRATRKRTDFVTEHDGRETEGLRRMQRKSVKTNRSVSRVVAPATSTRRATKKRPPLVKVEKMIKAKPSAPIRKPLAKKRSAMRKPRQAVQTQPTVSTPRLTTLPKPALKKKPPLIRRAPRMAAKKHRVAESLPKSSRPGTLPEPQPE